MDKSIPLLWFEDYSDKILALHAAIQGAANFTPVMLPNLWSDHPCPYSKNLYREAWYRGFYSAACWYLINSIIKIGQTWKPDLGRMFEWYCKEHTNQEWIRVPGGREHT